MSAPRVTIVLPTLNGARDLERLLPALAAQELDGGFELRAIDSESDDRTVELLERAGAHVERIPRASFRHGRTRNQCARGARGEVLVFLSQDALPCDVSFLAELVRPLAEDERAAGAYARILPHEDDDPLTKRTVLAAPEASAEPRVYERLAESSAPSNGVERVPARGARAHAVHFNNVASAIRRDVFEQYPFPDVPFGEDLAWATNVFAHGWRIHFAAHAVVLHSHRYGMRGGYARYKLDASFHRHVEGTRVRPTFASALKGFAYELKQDLAYVREHGGALHLARAPFLRGAQVFGQWRGSQDTDAAQWSAARR
jgi:rhamnosyltransferase